MTVIIDVSMEQFNFFRRSNGMFFWTEEKRSFILLKPFEQAWLRVIVKKKDKRTDDLFKGLVLSQDGAVFAPRILGLDDSLVQRRMLDYFEGMELKSRVME